MALENMNPEKKDVTGQGVFVPDDFEYETDTNTLFEDITSTTKTPNVEVIDVEAVVVDKNKVDVEVDVDSTTKGNGIIQAEAKPIIDVDAEVIDSDISDGVETPIIIEAEFEEIDSEIIVDQDEDEVTKKTKTSKNEAQRHAPDVVEEKAESQPQNEKFTVSGTMTPEEVLKKLNNNPGKYYAVHEGSQYEQGVADKLNEFEQKRVESEARINRLLNQKRDLQNKIHGKGLLRKAFSYAFARPAIGLWRFFQKVIGRGKYIAYSPEEIALKDVKEKIKSEREKVIYIKKASKDYVKMMDIQIEDNAPVQSRANEKSETQQTQQQAQNKAQDNIAKEKPPVTTEKETSTTQPDKEGQSAHKQQNSQTQNTAKPPKAINIFEQMMKRIYGDTAISAKREDGTTFLDVTDNAGEVHRFTFDPNKGNLSLFVPNANGDLDKDVVARIQKDAYITYTLANAQAQKPIVADGLVNIASKEINKMLNGETKYANFKMGCIPIAISSQGDGTYTVEFNGGKNKPDIDMAIIVSGEDLRGDNLKETLTQMKLTYAATMYKAIMNEKFIDFIKDKAVVKNLDKSPAKAVVTDFEKHNNNITFKVALQNSHNQAPTIVPITLSTRTFEAFVSNDAPINLSQSEIQRLTKAVTTIEKGLAAFVVEACLIKPEEALPSKDELRMAINQKINSIPEGQHEQFELCGVSIAVDKGSESTQVTVFTNNGQLLDKSVIYDGELDNKSFSMIYEGMKVSIQQQANSFARENAVYQQDQEHSTGDTVGDSVLNGDNVPEAETDTGTSLNEMTDHINDIHEAQAAMSER